MMKKLILLLTIVLIGCIAVNILYADPGNKVNNIEHDELGQYITEANPAPRYLPDAHTNTIGTRLTNIAELVASLVADAKIETYNVNATQEGTWTDSAIRTRNSYITDGTLKAALNDHIADIIGSGGSSLVVSQDANYLQEKGHIFEVYHNEIDLDIVETIYIGVYVPATLTDVHIQVGGEGTSRWKIQPYWSATMHPGGVTITPYDTNRVTNNTSELQWYYKAVTSASSTPGKPLIGGSEGFKAVGGGALSSGNYIIGPGTYLITMDSKADNNDAQIFFRYTEHD